MIEILPQSICAWCLGSFLDEIDRKRITGRMGYYCDHNNVLLIATADSGVMTSWVLSSAQSRAHAEHRLRSAINHQQRSIEMNADTEPRERPH